MIRKLIIIDQEKVLEYLYKEASLNIFIIGDIENYGFDKDFQTIYGEFDKDNNYMSVLLNYRENMIYYSDKEYFNEEWLKVINTFDYKFFSGSKKLIALIEPYIEGTTNKTMYFAEAKSIEIDNNGDYEEVIELKDEKDASLLYDLLIDIPEFFGMKDQKREDFIDRKMQHKSDGLTYIIKRDEKVISSAATVAETSINAMVIAVATDKDYRKLGLASKIMIKLIKEYIDNKKKYLCLFYDNPEAGKIYKRLGFKDVDFWVMLLKE